MLVFARRKLVPDGLLGPASLPAGDCALLLEGDWDDAPGDIDTQQLLSLDTYIDAARFAHLDVEALQLAAATSSTDAQPNFADINALRLRYETLRWLRVIAFWRDYVSVHETDAVDLYVSPRRDNEYALLWRAMSQAFGFTLRIHFILRDEAPATPLKLPPNAWWRRTLGRLFANRTIDRDRSSPATSNHRPRLLFVGNPRILDPICDAALDRGANAAWLYDRFAVGAWWKRRTREVSWLTCDQAPILLPPGEGGRRPDEGQPSIALKPNLDYTGVNLTEVADSWLRRWHRILGTSQARQWQRVGEHLATFRPSHIVLDEDATPHARIVIAHAARLGIPTMVVQHGVCCVRFGFAPLAADRFCVWNEGTRRQLAAWGVAAERIAVTGPTSEQLAMREALRNNQARRNSVFNKKARRRIVLLATMPPRDDRPDAVEFHLTTRTYAAMLDAACAAVAELNRDVFGSAELIIKPHPRAPHDAILARTLVRFPTLRYRIVGKESLSEVLASADCVLSCVSSAGVDAAVAGLPVVQLLPQGSGPVLPADWYGLLGSARTLEELRPLLAEALHGRVAGNHRPNTGNMKSSPTKSSAAAIVELLLRPTTTRRTDAPHGVPAPHFSSRPAMSASEETSHG